MRGYGDGAFLTNTDPNQTLVHASDHVAEAHVGVIGMITRVAVGQKILTVVISKQTKSIIFCKILFYDSQWCIIVFLQTDFSAAV